MKKSYIFFILFTLYLKKLFSKRNVVMFIATFLLLFTTYQVVMRLWIGLDFYKNPLNLLEDHWVIYILFLNMYFIMFINFAYIYLKQNNIKNISNEKNTICNFLILIFLFIVFYGILFLVFSIAYGPSKYDTNGNMIPYYLNPLYLFFVMLFFNLISIFTISLLPLGSKRTSRFEYLIVIFIFIMSISFFFYVLKINDNAIRDEVAIFKHIMIVEIYIFAGLVFVNLIKRFKKMSNFKIKKAN